jgi:hypothetical protein
MSLGVQIGLLLALATALTSIVGFLLKAKGANAAPPVEWSKPVRSSVALFRSGWYTLGILVAMGGWALHVGALSLAPISLVQSTIAGGLVLLTVVADRVFGYEVTRREWIGVALTAIGLAFLAATLEHGADGAHSDYTPATLAVFVGALTAVAVVAWRVARPGRAGAPALALSAGLLWGASDTSIKALSGDLGHAGAAHILFHPLAFAILALSLVGLLVSAGSLQVGDAVPVIAVTSAAANICTIAAGPLVFREPLPDTDLGVALRIAAFVLVISAAALTPPPIAPAEPPEELRPS